MLKDSFKDIIQTTVLLCKCHFLCPNEGFSLYLYKTVSKNHCLLVHFHLLK